MKPSCASRNAVVTGSNSSIAHREQEGHRCKMHFFRVVAKKHILAAALINDHSISFRRSDPSTTERKFPSKRETLRYRVPGKVLRRRRGPRQAEFAGRPGANSGNPCQLKVHWNPN